MQRIDEVFSTSFDQLLENIFQSSNHLPNAKQSFQPDSIGGTIELYREKKQLEAMQKKLKRLLREKNATIVRLKQQVLHQLSVNKTIKEQQASGALESEGPSQWLAKVSHELRTPVNGIAGIASLLKEGSLSPDQQQLVSLLERSTRSLTLLINDLLDFSKLEKGAMTLEQTPFALSEAVGECVDLLTFNAGEKGLDFSYTLAPELPDPVIGDPLRLRQVLMNLAGNAIKFTEKGSVRIAAAPVTITSNDVTVRFEVQDTGIGIPQADCRILFQAYMQAEAATARKYGGTGLGLAICRELIQLMGGEIGVDSVEGKGSTFWFTACFGRDATAAHPAQKEPDACPPLNRSYRALRVLLVEDEPITRQVSAALLKRSGLEAVDMAETGREAIRKLQETRYDLVLMDMQMPEMDGIEATRCIREANSGVTEARVPIVAMTANSRDSEREACLSAGMDGFISKPLDPAALNRTLERIIGSQPLSSVNRQQLQAVREDLGENFSLLVRIFLEQLPEKLVSLQAAVLANERETVKSLAHALKGNCASLSAETMSELCGRLESAAKSPAPDLTHLFFRLEKESLAVTRHFQSLI